MSGWSSREPPAGNRQLFVKRRRGGGADFRELLRFSHSRRWEKVYLRCFLKTSAAEMLEYNVDRVSYRYHDSVTPDNPELFVRNFMV